MAKIWRKLQRLKPLLSIMCKSIKKPHIQLEKAINDLNKAQQALAQDMMNTQKFDMIKNCTKEVLKWSSLEEYMLKQISKHDRRKVGDGNNSYFHATLKVKNKLT